MADWATISALATAGGTLVLAGATFASVRSANRAARAAEASLLAGLRPLLVPSRLDDAEQKVAFVDGKRLLVQGGGAAAEASEDWIYAAISIRNVGTGIAVLHGWHLYPGMPPDIGAYLPPDEFTRLTRASTSPPATSASGRERSATRRCASSPTSAGRSSPGSG